MGDGQTKPATLPVLCFAAILAAPEGPPPVKQG